MNLVADFALRRGSFELAVDLEVDASGTVAIVGPNGAGKSSLLAAIAGLLRIDRGSLRLGDRTLDGGPGGTFVPPEQRGVGMVFQDHLLFPHLRVVDNVAFGLRARGVARRQARDEARRWLDRVGLAEHEGRLPAQLSGGQAQRVALARALAARPSVLLLDEPLSSIDARTKVELRGELRRHLDAFAGPRLVVTHDAVDAFALAQRIVVLEEGRVVQQGSVAEICGRPRSRYVGDLVGTNVFRGVASNGVLRLANGGSLVVPAEPAGEVFATVHPRAVALYRVRPDGTPRNVFAVRIVAIVPAGDRMRVQVDGDVPLVAEVTPQAVADLALAAGGEAWVALKATEIALDPA
ncbi:MAG: ABC transporter ATP-binding protein [Planctomycetes bacterium]|nr:ABC transporter ATP-binding protein [Planctomycetota bacterium]